MRSVGDWQKVPQPNVGIGPSEGISIPWPGYVWMPGTHKRDELVEIIWAKIKYNKEEEIIIISGYKGKYSCAFGQNLVT